MPLTTRERDPDSVREERDVVRESMRPAVDLRTEGVRIEGEERRVAGELRVERLETLLRPFRTRPVDARERPEETEPALARLRETPEPERNPPERVGARAGRLIDRDGRLADRDGRLIDRDGRLTDRDGRLTDRDGRLIDRDGRLIDRPLDAPEPRDAERPELRPRDWASNGGPQKTSRVLSPKIKKPSGRRRTMTPLPRRSCKVLLIVHLRSLGQH